MPASAWESLGLQDPDSFRVEPVAPPPEPEKGDFGRGFGIAFREVEPLAKASVGLVGATVGSDAVRDWGYNGYQAAMQKIAPDRKETDELTTAYDRAKNGDLGAIVDWVQYGLGYVAGQVSQAAAVGIIGAVAGGAAAGPGGAVAGGAGGAAAGVAGQGAVRTLASKIAGSLIEKQAAKIAEVKLAEMGAQGAVTEAARAAVMEGAKATAAKAVGQAIGAGAGTVGITAIQESGSIFADATEEAKKQGRELNGDDLARIWASTAGATVLESASDLLGLGALTGRIKFGGSATGRIGRAATGAGILGATEGATEVGQTAFERFGARKDLTGEDATKDYINSGALGILGGAASGGISGAVHRPKAPEEQIKDIVDAPDLQSAVEATRQAIAGLGVNPPAGSRVIDPALMTAADTQQAAGAMTDDALVTAQSRFEQEAAAAQQMMREQAMNRIQAPTQPAVSSLGPQIDQRRQEAGVANSAEDQVSREAGIDQMRAEQVQGALQAPIPQGQTTDLATGQTQEPIQGPMQAAFARLQEQRNAGARPVRPDVGQAVQPAVQESVAGNSNDAAAVELPGRDTGGSGLRVSSGQSADAVQNTGQIAADRVPAGQSANAVDVLNLSLANQRKQRGEDSTQPAVTAVDPESLPTMRKPLKAGGATLSKHEFETVKKFAGLFGKKVELFRHNDPTSSDKFDGAVLDTSDTIYLNADARDAHHLVVVGHEVGHQLKKDAPDLYKQLETRLKANLSDGNLANFARYYGKTDKELYAQLQSAEGRGAIVEEFISDLIGNRSAEYRTMLDIFGAAKGSKDAGMIYKVAQFLVDFIDGLIAKINRSKFETDRLVKDLDKVRREVRAALKEYAVRQNKVDMQVRMKDFGKKDAAPRPESKKQMVLQNRDRSTPASVAQMISIAAKPDYGRLGFSRDFANGAPVVAGSLPDGAVLGKTDVAIAADGRRIPVQYAAVEAADVLPSNQSDGSANAGYAAAGKGLRAIAGNGRIAGLQSAFKRGSEKAYVNEMKGDSLHGVDRAGIEAMKAPILVRVMPQDAVTKDIGDVSNTVGNLDLSAVEQAKNDANRVDLEGLEFSEDGSITPDTIRKFVQAMPASERGGLIDTDGQATRQAVDRLTAAIFSKAYQNDELVRLHVQAQDPEARVILGGMSQAAPRMVRLDGLGAMDLRPLVVEAAQVAINARRQGVSLERASKQVDMGVSPDTRYLITMFANNSRSQRNIAGALSRLANSAYAESNKPLKDLFGAVPRLSKEEILGAVNEQQGPEDVGDAGRGVGTQEVGARRSAERSRAEDSQRNSSDGQREEGSDKELKKSASRQTDTPAFRKWFGESVVTKDGKAGGEPLVVYHGSPDARFVNEDGIFATTHDRMLRYGGTEASKKEADDERGFFFTTGSKVAKTYANDRRAFDYQNAEPAVISAYLSVKNPLEIDAKGKHWREAQKGISKNDFIVQAKKQGHDGVVIRNVRDSYDSMETGRDPSSDVFVAFESKQIKSATNNDGKFDASNPDIRKSGQRAPAFYSALAKAVSGINAKSQPAFGWKQQIEALIRKGDVKADEVQWTGLNEFLDLQQGKVSKESVEQFLSANGVRLEETMLGGRDINGRLREAKSKFENDAPGWAYDRMDFDESPMSLVDPEGAGYVFDPEEQTWMKADEDGDPIAGEAVPAKVGKAALELGNAFDATNPDFDGRPNDTKYGSYVVPGGKNYKELLLTLPVAPRRYSYDAFNPATQKSQQFETRQQAESFANEDATGATVVSEIDTSPRPDYQSAHWDQSNVIAHTRIDERADADGNRVLFVNEIQSDYGQDGKKKGFAVSESRKLSGTPKEVGVDGPFPEWIVEWEDGSFSGGYGEAAARARAAEGKSNAKAGLPPAPFVQKTDAWVGLTLKRLIMHAVEKGFDKVAIINGEQAADLYDLSKRVKSIDYRLNPSDGTYNITVLGLDGQGEIWGSRRATLQQIEDHVGKETAQKIEKNEGRDLGFREPNFDRSLSGDGLKVGGEGMRTFYNSIVPKVAKSVLKKLGGTVGSTTIATDKNGWHITPSNQTTSGKWMVKSNDYNSVGLKFDTEEEARAALAKKQKTSEQTSFDITPEMRETVLQNGVPLFSRQRSPSLGQLNPAQEAAAKAVGAIVKPQTKKEAFDKFKANLGLRLRQGIVDQFAAIKEIDPAAYRLARMSKNESGPLEALMMYGKPTIKDGIYDVKIDPKGGFAKVLADLDGEHDRFLLWVAAKRADRLKSEGRENLFTDTDISSLKTLNKGREVKFDKALMALNEYNESTLKIAMDSGLIDQEAYDTMKSQPYVPFYRVMDDGIGASGPRFSSGLKGQSAFKKLKGGTNQLNQDLLSNVMQNWSHLYAASARNRAMDASVAAAEKIGIAYPVASGTKNAVKFMRGGVTQHYLIEDDYLFEAVSAVEAQTPSWMKGFSAFKTALTVGVTASPTFRIRNLIRDSIAVIGQSEIGVNPLTNVKAGMKALEKDSQTRASLIAGGGVIRFGAMLEGSNQTNRLIEKQMKKGVVLNQSNWKKLTGQMGDLWDAYQEIGDKAEGANRAALYEQLRAKGKSHAEASFMSRDLMDFSMSGRWPVVRFLAQSIPFFNARLVGLFKLGRSFKDNPQRMYYTAAALSIASIALAAAQGDDEDFKKLEDWRRDAYWNFKIGGMMFSIPKPFELGAIGTLAERTFELAFDKEMTGKRYRERLSAMLTQTFAMSPIPQIAKPLIDVWSNKDSFTGRAIETMGMDRLRPQDRYNERTSAAAKLLGQMGLPNPASLMMGQYSSLSPVQIDSLVKGYFGWLGVTTTSALEYGLRPMTDGGTKPSMQLRDVFLAGSFVESLPSGSSRYVTQFYDQAKEIEQAYASYRDALKRGDTTKAMEIMESDRDKIVKHGLVSGASKSFANYNSQTKQIIASKLMSPDEKRRMLDYIAAQKNRLAESVRLN